MTERSAVHAQLHKSFESRPLGFDALIPYWMLFFLLVNSSMRRNSEEVHLY